MDIASVLAFMTLLSIIGEPAAENIFAAYLTGLPMRLAAIATTIALAFGIWYVKLPIGANLNALTWQQVLIIGALSGLPANILHSILANIAPTAGNGTLSSALKSAGSATSSSPPKSAPI